MKNSVNSLVLFLVLFSTACDDTVDPQVVIPDDVNLDESIFVHINLNDRSGDTFKVEMYVNGLTSDNAVIQFAATMPGTYDILNAGRFVKNFKAYDEADNSVLFDELSTNQFKLVNPESTFKITYEVKETFDTEVSQYPVFAMAGTSIEDDHVLLNTPMVIGYPEGLKERDYFVSLSYPDDWTLGTALPEFESNIYRATDFDHLADSPILLGQLTTSTTQVSEADINVHVYSEGDNINSEMIMNDVNQVILDAEAFLEVLPTDRYDFLYHFGDRNAGALEHSKSSVYVLPDGPYSSNYGAAIKSISAHEFFHVVTPLNIHSEIIADFNFAEPTPSQHLWLYEGVTEWASDYMQYRNGSMTLSRLLSEMGRKVEVNSFFDESYSLVEISTESYTQEGGEEFVNIYNRGAFIISLLDIRLLELSDGKKGMREVVLELIDTYGPDKAFDEANFFDSFVDMTYPEIEDFIDRYIKGTEALPIEEYYAKVGIDYDAGNFEFTQMSSLTDSQSALFEAWSQNL